MLGFALAFTELQRVKEAAQAERDATIKVTDRYHRVAAVMQLRDVLYWTQELKDHLNRANWSTSATMCGNIMSALLRLEYFDGEFRTYAPLSAALATTSNRLSRTRAAIGASEKTKLEKVARSIERALQNRLSELISSLGPA